MSDSENSQPEIPKRPPVIPSLKASLSALAGLTRSGTTGADVQTKAAQPPSRPSAPGVAGAPPPPLARKATGATPPLPLSMMRKAAESPTPPARPASTPPPPARGSEYFGPSSVKVPKLNLKFDNDEPEAPADDERETDEELNDEPELPIPNLAELLSASAAAKSQVAVPPPPAPVPVPVQTKIEEPEEEELPPPPPKPYNRDAFFARSEKVRSTLFDVPEPEGGGEPARVTALPDPRQFKVKKSAPEDQSPSVADPAPIPIESAEVARPSGETIGKTEADLATLRQTNIEITQQLIGLRKEKDDLLGKVLTLQEQQSQVVLELEDLRSFSTIAQTQADELAQQNAALTADLEGLTNENRSLCEQLEATNPAAEQENAVLKEALESLKKQTESGISPMAQVGDAEEIEALQQEVLVLKRSTSTAAQDLVEVEREKAVVVDRLKAVEAEKNNLSTQCRELKDRLNLLGTAGRDWESRLGTLEDQLAVASNFSEQMTAENSDLRLEAKNLKQEADTLRAAIVEAKVGHGELAALKQENKDLHDKIGELTEQLANVKLSSLEIHDERAALLTHADSLREELDGLKAEGDQLRAQLAEAEAQPKQDPALIAQLASLQAETEALKAEATELRSQIAELEARPRQDPVLVTQNIGLQEELYRLRTEATQLKEQLTEATAQPQQDPVYAELLANVESLSSNIILVMNGEGRIIWATESYTRILGYTRKADSNAFLNDLLAEDHATFQEALDRAFNGEENTINCRIQTQSGSWSTLQVTLSPISGPQGIDQLLLQAVDKSDQVALEKALNSAQAARVNAAAALHLQNDFKVYINQMGENCAMTRKVSTGHAAVHARLNEMEKILGKAKDAVDHLNQVIHPEPAIGLTRRSTALDAFVADLVSPLIRNTGWKMQFTMPGDLPEVNIEPESFAKAIRNIISNSLQSATQGTIVFSARAVPADKFEPVNALDRGDYVVLSITDDGPGIAPAVKNHIFDRHFTTKPGSSGMGLNDAKVIMGKLGGTLELSSTPGSGTVVNFYIPYKVLLAANLTKSGGIYRKMRVLLMDDEPMILDILTRMLENLNYIVTGTLDGNQAIQAAARAKATNMPFDIILMDLIIPQGLGGADALPTISKINPTAKIIASSGHLDHPAIREYQKYGFSAVLQKPYKLEKLQAVLHELSQQQANETPIAPSDP